MAVITDMFGCTAFYRHVAGRLAAAGFNALIPHYFFRLPPLVRPGRDSAIGRWRTFDEQRGLDDLAGTLAWAASRFGSAGVLGFCLGGTFALDLASLAAPRATVAYYGFPLAAGYARVAAPAPMDLVRQQRGPVLAFWGTDDEPVGLGAIHDYVGRAGREAENFRHVLYEGAPHGFLAKSALADGATAGDPAGDSWIRTLGHFRRYLAS